MGKIQQQTIKGGIFSYIGVAIGAITTGYIMPHSLLPQEIGVTKLLIAYVTIFSQFANLGFNNVTVRLFTYFRNYHNIHNGYFRIGITVITIGFILASTIFYFLMPYWHYANIKSPMFTQQLYLVVALSYFMMVFNFIDTYYTQLYKAVHGVIHREFSTRLLVLASLGAYYYLPINFEQFILLYAASFSFSAFAMLWHAYKAKAISWRITPGFVTPKLRREMFTVGSYGMIMGFSGMAILNIDSIMLGSMLGTAATGVYAITFFAGTLVIIPSRALQKIATAYYADAWKSNNTKLIHTIYRKSSINQFYIGTIILLLIWISADQLLSFLPSTYMQGKYVILFIGLANLVDMLSGTNIVIISTSPHYRMLTIFIGILLIIVVLGNLILIPIAGISGAALASLSATVSYNIMRASFLYIKYRFQPLQIAHLIITVLAMILYYVSHLLPSLDSTILDIALRSTVIAISYAVATYYLRVSPEYTQIIDNIIARSTFRSRD